MNLDLSYKNIGPFQHRTLPLSASLSSPLPSTSDSFDRQAQFATFSSVVNISSSDGDEPPSSMFFQIQIVLFEYCLDLEGV